MSNAMQTYDSDNIFAKIIRGEIPCHKIYEDDETLAFMDVMPESQGHCLVIPKSETRNLMDADPMTLGNLIAVTQKIAKAAKTAFSADGIAIKQFNELAAGQTVFHLHFHVIPRYEGVALSRHANQMADNDKLAADAEKIKAGL